MANHLLPHGKEALLGSVDLVNDSIKVLLVDSSWTPSDSVQFVSDITGTAVLGRSGALGSKSVTSGTFKCGNGTITGVAAGKSASYVYGFKDAGGADSANPLLWFEDSGTNIPLTTDGADITLSWDATNGVFTWN
jgi:hypothetical protein